MHVKNGNSKGIPNKPLLGRSTKAVGKICYETEVNHQRVPVKNKNILKIKIDVRQLIRDLISLHFVF